MDIIQELALGDDAKKSVGSEQLLDNIFYSLNTGKSRLGEVVFSHAKFPIRPALTPAGVTNALKYFITAKIGKSNPLAKMYSTDPAVDRFMNDPAVCGTHSQWELFSKTHNTDAVMFLPAVFKVGRERVCTELTSRLGKFTGGEYSFSINSLGRGRGMCSISRHTHTDSGINSELLADSVDMFCTLAAYAAIGSGRLEASAAHLAGEDAIYKFKVNYLKISAISLFTELLGKSESVVGVDDHMVKFLRKMLLNLKTAISCESHADQDGQDSYKWVFSNDAETLFYKSFHILSHAILTPSTGATKQNANSMLWILNHCSVEYYDIARTKKGCDSNQTERLKIAVIFYSHHLEERYIRHMGALPKSEMTFSNFTELFYSDTLNLIWQFCTDSDASTYPIHPNGKVQYPTVVHQLTELSTDTFFGGLQPHQLTLVKEHLKTNGHDISALADGIAEIFEMYDKMNVDSAGDGVVTFKLEKVTPRLQTHNHDIRVGELPEDILAGGWAASDCALRLVGDALNNGGRVTTTTTHTLMFAMSRMEDTFYAEVMLEESDFIKLMAGQNMGGGNHSHEAFSGTGMHCRIAYTEALPGGGHAVRVAIDGRKMTTDFSKCNVTLDIYEDDKLSLVSSTMTKDSIMRMTIKIPNKEPYQGFCDQIHCIALLHG